MLVNFGSFLRARARKGLQDEGSGTVQDVSEISQMLYDTNISRNQIESIIRNIGNKLKTLDICFNLAIRETPRQVFTDAESKIEEFSYLMH